MNSLPNANQPLQQMAGWLVSLQLTDQMPCGLGPVFPPVLFIQHGPQRSAKQTGRRGIQIACINQFAGSGEQVMMFCSLRLSVCVLACRTAGFQLANPGGNPSLSYDRRHDRKKQQNDQQDHLKSISLTLHDIHKVAQTGAIRQQIEQPFEKIDNGLE